MDWLDLLAVQGTLKSLLQHRSHYVRELQLFILHNMVLGITPSFTDEDQSLVICSKLINISFHVLLSILWRLKTG